MSIDTGGTRSGGNTETREPEASSGSSHDAYTCLVAIYQDSSLDPKLHLGAAKAALPYEKAPRKAMELVNQGVALTEARRQELLAHYDETLMVRDREAEVAAREHAVSAREAQLSDGGA